MKKNIPEFNHSIKKTTTDKCVQKNTHTQTNLLLRERERGRER